MKMCGERAAHIEAKRYLSASFKMTDDETAELANKLKATIEKNNKGLWV